MRWTLKPKPDPVVVDHLSEVLGVEKLIASLLAQRGIKSFEQARDFFRPSLENLHDPFQMKDMDLAVLRIEKALEKAENIMIYGDYDVDGTTSVALVSSYLKTYYPNVATYIPDRYNEGYGVSIQGIDYAADNDISLIIALDCGIKAIDKIAYASEKGIDFIICDHHRPGSELPQAVAVLDPKRADCHYPYKELCGCGVGFKLLQALNQRRGQAFETLIPYLDLVATAIGADIVPVTGENRILAFHGLRVINAAPRPGFRAILEEVKNTSMTITDVVFLIAPQINAAGRMRHGLYAVNLLTEEDEYKAKQMASEIRTFNSERRAIDKIITKEALVQIETAREQNHFTTVVYQENWHKGVIGIVASRLTETYYRPTLVFTRSGAKLAASARSVKGFDVYEALERCSDYIEQFGGHKYAAGLTLLESQYNDFRKKFEEVVSEKIDKNLLIPEIAIDTEIRLAEITPKFHRILKQFEPFGPENLAPVFMTTGLRDTGLAKCVGAEGLHLKCRLKDNNSSVHFDAIGFSLGSKCDLLAEEKEIRAAYSVDENQWQGNVNVQLKLKDLSLM